MWKRESRAGVRQRSGASPAAGSGDGGAGLEEDGGAASGETHSQFGSWRVVGGGGASRRRREKYSWYSEHLGVGRWRWKEGAEGSPMSSLPEALDFILSTKGKRWALC